MARPRCRDREVPVQSAREGRPPRTHEEAHVHLPRCLPEAEALFSVHVGAETPRRQRGSPGAPSGGPPSPRGHCCFQLMSNQVAPQLSGFVALAAGNPGPRSEPALETRGVHGPTAVRQARRCPARSACGRAPRGAPDRAADTVRGRGRSPGPSAAGGRRVRGLRRPLGVGVLSPQGGRGGPGPCSGGFRETRKEAERVSSSSDLFPRHLPFTRDFELAEMLQEQDRESRERLLCGMRWLSAGLTFRGRRPSPSLSRARAGSLLGRLVWGPCPRPALRPFPSQLPPFAVAVWRQACASSCDTKPGGTGAGRPPPSVGAAQTPLRTCASRGWFRAQRASSPADQVFLQRKPNLPLVTPVS